MQILRIRDRAAGLSISYLHEEDRINHTSGRIPSASFVQALDGLKPIVQAILDVTEQWMGRVKITGITLSPCGEDNHTVTIVARRELAVGGSPLNIATPLRFLAPGAEEDGGNVLALSASDADLVKAICREAEIYVKDNPAMRQMFLPLGSPAGLGVVVEGVFTTPEVELAAETTETPKKKSKAATAP